MAGSEPTPDQLPEIERIPFARLSAWAATHLWANWVFFVSLIWVAAGGLYLLFVFAGKNEDIGFPELTYGIGMLLIVVGLQMVLLDLLAEHHRATVRLYAEVGTAGPPEIAPENLRHAMAIMQDATPEEREASLKLAQVLAKKPRDITLNYNAVLGAIRDLPLARFLIVAGIVTLFLGAGVDGKWHIPDISFTTDSGAIATPEP